MMHRSFFFILNVLYSTENFEIKVLVEECKGGEVGQPQMANDERTRGSCLK